MYRNIYGALPLPSAEAVRNEYAKGGSARREILSRRLPRRSQPGTGAGAGEKLQWPNAFFFSVHRDYYIPVGETDPVRRLRLLRMEGCQERIRQLLKGQQTLAA